MLKWWPCKKSWVFLRNSRNKWIINTFKKLPMVSAFWFDHGHGHHNKTIDNKPNLMPWLLFSWQPILRLNEWKTRPTRPWPINQLLSCTFMHTDISARHFVILILPHFGRAFYLWYFYIPSCCSCSCSNSKCQFCGSCGTSIFNIY